MKTIKKINFDFDEVPIVLFSITNGNEFKIITYLNDQVRLNNNSTVNVSLTHICKALHISKQTLITSLNNLIKLNLISRVSGNGNNSNAYTINFDYINELDSKQTLEIPIEEAILYSLLLKKLETIK